MMAEFVEENASDRHITRPLEPRQAAVDREAIHEDFDPRLSSLRSRVISSRDQTMTIPSLTSITIICVSGVRQNDRGKTVVTHFGKRRQETGDGRPHPDGWRIARVVFVDRHHEATTRSRVQSPYRTAWLISLPALPGPPALPGHLPSLPIGVASRQMCSRCSSALRASI